MIRPTLNYKHLFILIIQNIKRKREQEEYINTIAHVTNNAKYRCTYSSDLTLGPCHQFTCLHLDSGYGHKYGH